MIRRAKMGKLSPETVEELKKLVEKGRSHVTQLNEIECDAEPRCPLCNEFVSDCLCSPADLHQWACDEMFRLRKENETLKLTQAKFHGGYVVYDDEKWWRAEVVNREQDEALERIEKLEADLAERDAIIESQLCKGCDHSDIERLTKDADYWKARADENHKAHATVAYKLDVVEGMLRKLEQKINGMRK